MRISKSLRPIEPTRKHSSTFLLHFLTFLFSLSLAAQNAGHSQKAVNSPGGLTVPMAMPDSDSLAITNPKELDIPEARARALHKIVHDTVADYLHVAAKKETHRVVLVLGEKREHFTFGGGDQVDTIYLQRWNEAKFVSIDASLAVQDLFSVDGLNRIAQEVSRRSDRLLPVSLDQLRSGSVSRPQKLPPAMHNPCLTAMSDASQPGARCEPSTYSLP